MERAAKQKFQYSSSESFKCSPETVAMERAAKQKFQYSSSESFKCSTISQCLAASL